MTGWPKMSMFSAVTALSIAFTAAAGDNQVTVKVDFEDQNLKQWTLTDSSAWEIVDSGDEHKKVLALTKLSKYTPKVRSPFSIALLSDQNFTDFVLDVEMKSTGGGEAHQDLCLFFGHQDAEHFYYIHLGRKADPHAHSVFLVNNEPRVSIAKERTDGTPWTKRWHKVRLERDTKTGDIKVYFDDMEKPIMHAVDKTFTWGKLGLGSFDNTGLFDNLVIRGTTK